jgi:hypothetical protein
MLRVEEGQCGLCGLPMDEMESRSNSAVGSPGGSPSISGANAPPPASVPVGAASPNTGAAKLRTFCDERGTIFSLQV